MACFSACTEDTETNNPFAASTFYELSAGSYTDNGVFTEKQSKVITSQSSYEAALAVYSNDSPETIDFTAGQVLLVDMGERNSGGYAIEVTSMDEDEETVTAYVQLTQPADECSVTDALTNPYQLVYIETLKQVLISESLFIQNCS